MVAAILDLDKGARTVGKGADHMRRRFRNPHDIGHPDIGPVAVQPELEIGRIIFVDIADHSAGFRHRREHRWIDLGRATGDDDIFFRIVLLRPADRLPRLPHSLVGHRTAVDDDQIVAVNIARRQILPQLLALGDIEPASHADHLRSAHPNSVQSTSPAKT